MKIVTVVGARPQFIKAAALSRTLRQLNRKGCGVRSKKRVREILIHTGQHYDVLMDRVFFEELKIPKPDYHLGVGSGPHGMQTGRMLERIEPILQKEKPSVVLVYGDTNSTLAGALAAIKLHIPVAHVEAGLRSYDRSMPEELNRVLTDHVSQFLFCPTDQAVTNLSREGIKDQKEGRWVKKSGDVMYDALRYYSHSADDTILRKVKVSGAGSGIRDYYLATIHRAENTDDPKRLQSIFDAFDKIAETAPVVLPLHPRTRKIMKAKGIHPRHADVTLLEPLSYLKMLVLEKNAKAILTDSGGIQKEAYWLKVPCITLREVTEWGYPAEEGWNIIAGWKTADIIRAARKVSGMNRPKRRNVPSGKTASEKIIQTLLDAF